MSAYKITISANGNVTLTIDGTAATTTQYNSFFNTSGSITLTDTNNEITIPAGAFGQNDTVEVVYSRTFTIHNAGTFGTYTLDGQKIEFSNATNGFDIGARYVGSNLQGYINPKGVSYYVNEQLQADGSNSNPKPTLTATKPTSDLNFSEIFSSNASSSYTWTSSDYLKGWQTVGNSPPTRTQFDALQKISDSKDKYLLEYARYNEQFANYLNRCVTWLDGKIDDVDDKSVTEIGKWYIRFGDDDFIFQVGIGRTDSTGIARCNFSYSFSTFPSSNGMYLPVVTTWAATQNKTYTFAITEQKANYAKVRVRTAAGEVVPDFMIGVLALGINSRYHTDGSVIT